MIEIAFALITAWIIAAAIWAERGTWFATGHFFPCWSQEMERVMGPQPRFYLVSRAPGSGMVNLEVCLPGGLAFYAIWGRRDR